MTYPITPNPGIHNPPTQQVFQTGAGSGAQLATWAKQLPLAMTLELINVILEALGLGAYTGPVDEIITTLSNALTARFGALGVLLESVLTDVLTDYNDWPVLINALEQAWLTYVTTVTQLDEQEIVTLIEIVGALLGISPAEIQRLVTDFEALEADSEAAAAAFNTLLLSWWTDITTDYADWPVLIAAMEQAWNTYITTITQIDESEILTLEDITGALLGISPQTLQELNNDFTNLQTDSTEKSAALTTLFQAVWTDITTESGSALLTSLDAAWNTYVTTVTGIETSEISTLEDIVGAILGVSPAAIAQFYTDFTDFLSTGSWTDLTNAWADLNALISGNASDSGMAGNISATQITNDANSLQPASNFPAALSLEAAGQWTWDGTVGNGTPGSAKCVANGIEQILRGVVGDVQTAQVITVTGYVQWSGLTTSGSSPAPIQLQLLPSTGSPVVIGQISSPGSSGSWTKLTGTYTVPSGVTTVQILLVVTPSATGGTIWWDDITDDASGGFLPTLASDFTALQTDYNAKAAAFNTLLQSWWTDITTDTEANLGPTWWTTLITALETAWQTYITTITAINESELVTLEDILGAILGLSPATIQTLNTDFSTLQTDYNDASAAFVTFLQSIWTAIEDDLSNWSTLIAALEAAWNTYVTTVSGLETSEFATLQQIVNALFGINPTTGQVPQSNISSNLGLTSIEDDLTQFWDNLFGIGNSPTSSPVTATALPNITIGGVVDSIENHIQAIVDHSIQALFGGSSTGNPTSAMYPALTAIPAGNIVGSLSGTTVSFGATGGGSSAYQTSGATQTISWSHASHAGDNYVVVAVNFWTAKIFSNVVVSATYGGTAMSSLGVVEYNSGACGMELFGLAATAAGQTVDVFISGGVGTAIAVAGNSVSYDGWSSTSAATTASGSGTNPALTVASASGDAVVQAFGLAGGGTAALSSYNGTTRWNQGSVTEGDALTMVLGDAAGASTDVFDATANLSSLQAWGAIAVSLKPNS